MGRGGWGCGGGTLGWALGGGGEFAAIEFTDDAGYVGSGFGVGRDAVVAVDGRGTGVVGGDCELQAVGVVIGIVASEELIEIGGATGDVFFGREGVVDA